jgi:hypothetical protein
MFGLQRIVARPAVGAARMAIASRVPAFTGKSMTYACGWLAEKRESKRGKWTFYAERVEHGEKKTRRNEVDVDRGGEMERTKYRQMNKDSIERRTCADTWSSLSL